MSGLPEEICRRVESALPDLLAEVREAGGMAGVEREALLRHAEGCARCGRLVGEYRRTVDLIRSLPRRTAPPGFLDWVRQDVAAERNARLRLRLRRRRILVSSVAALILMGASGITLWSLLGGFRETGPEIAFQDRSEPTVGPTSGPALEPSIRTGRPRSAPRSLRPPEPAEETSRLSESAPEERPYDALGAPGAVSAALERVKETSAPAGVAVPGVELARAQPERATGARALRRAPRPAPLEAGPKEAETPAASMPAVGSPPSSFGSPQPAPPAAAEGLAGAAEPSELAAGGRPAEPVEPGEVGDASGKGDPLSDAGPAEGTEGPTAEGESAGRAGEEVSRALEVAKAVASRSPESVQEARSLGARGDRQSPVAPARGARPSAAPARAWEAASAASGPPSEDLVVYLASPVDSWAEDWKRLEDGLRADNASHGKAADALAQDAAGEGSASRAAAREGVEQGGAGASARGATRLPVREIILDVPPERIEGVRLAVLSWALDRGGKVGSGAEVPSPVGRPEDRKRKAAGSGEVGGTKDASTAPRAELQVGAEPVPRARDAASPQASPRTVRVRIRVEPDR